MTTSTCRCGPLIEPGIDTPDAYTSHAGSSWRPKSVRRTRLARVVASGRQARIRESHSRATFTAVASDTWTDSVGVGVARTCRVGTTAEGTGPGSIRL